MHVGTRYPFHPVYWATEVLFWPGFACWKGHARTGRVLDPPWDALDSTFDQISEAGLVVPDATQISWHFPLTSPSTATDLYISLEMIDFGGVNYGRWKALLKTSGVETAAAWAYKPIPIRVCTFGVDALSVINAPDPGSGFVYLGFEPASYADGGSPFPDY